MFEKRCGGVLCQIFGRCNVCTFPAKDLSSDTSNSAELPALNINSNMDEDRSIKSGGMSLPMWMRTNSKSRLFTQKLDIDENTFSPPENDDSFLVFKYKTKPQETSTGSGTITVTTTNNNNNTLSANSFAPNLDIAKHTQPCREFLEGKKEVAQFQRTGAHKQKSSGTDDGFKGDVAECGSSVVRVASQMISGKVVRGFEPYDEEERDYLKSGGFDPKMRRGSRSLPASPLQTPSSSPKSQRRNLNKYFTSSAYAEDHKPGSILATLLGTRDTNISRSVTAIQEEESKESHSEMVSKLEALKVEQEKKKQKQPKPSQLREMNFWSPTSM